MRFDTRDGVYWRSLPLDALAAAGRFDAAFVQDVHPGIDLARRTLGPPQPTRAVEQWIAPGDSAHDEGWPFSASARDRPSSSP